MKINHKDLVCHAFNGAIECKFLSALSNYLTELFYSGDTAVGTLSELGFSGAFVVVDAVVASHLTGHTVQFEIRSVAEAGYSDEKESNMNFEDVYKGYVIREDKALGMFVGPDTDRYRVVIRAQAARFTKGEALEYIQTGYFCENSECGFVIEDAT